MALSDNKHFSLSGVSKARLVGLILLHYYSIKFLMFSLVNYECLTLMLLDLYYFKLYLLLLEFCSSLCVLVIFVLLYANILMLIA